MKIREFIIMPQTINPMGLIHKPGVGPNNRFDYKNKGNNRANENKIKLSTDPNYFGAVGVEKYKATGPQVNIPIKQLVGFEPEDKMRDPKSMAKVDQIAKAVQSKKPMGPILARKYKNGYQVIDGHHRFWGHKKAGANFIKAQIVPPEDIEEEAPPGREKQVKALKKKFGKSGAYALAWAQHNKHGKPKKEAAGVGIVTKQNATKDVPVGGEYMNVKKLGLGKGKPKTMREEFAEFLENIDPKVWTELRAKGLVKPMEYDTPEARAAYKAQGLPYKPDISIITKHNMDTLSPERKKMLKPIRVSDQEWIDYMNKWWREERPKPEARDKTQQIKNAYKLLYKKDMVENFADGKKKGKSRPGRVKRSGASCNGSVTALRKRAKKASGEKAKMYHWCANMKSGRKKK